MIMVDDAALCGSLKPSFFQEGVIEDLFLPGEI